MNAYYSRRPKPGTKAYDYQVEHPEAKISTIRDYVKTLPYEARRQFSIDIIRRAMDRVEVNAHDRAIIEREVKKLENPTLCPPDVSQTQRSAPNVAEVQAGSMGFGMRGTTW